MKVVDFANGWRCISRYMCVFRKSLELELGNYTNEFGFGGGKG